MIQLYVPLDTILEPLQGLCLWISHRKQRSNNTGQSLSLALLHIQLFLTHIAVAAKNNRNYTITIKDRLPPKKELIL